MCKQGCGRRPSGQPFAQTARCPWAAHQHLPPPLAAALVQLMQADTFDLHSFHTLTGTTFMLLTEPHTPDAAELLRTT